jgi:hypothetical protein
MWTGSAVATPKAVFMNPAPGAALLALFVVFAGCARPPPMPSVDAPPSSQPPAPSSDGNAPQPGVLVPDAAPASSPVPPSVPAATSKAAPDTEIHIEEGACFGTCPVYGATLRGDGSIDYEGKAFVGVTGHRSAHVSPGAVAGLVRRFDEVHFDRLSWRKDCPEAYATDHSSVQLTLRRGKRAHTIDDDLGDGCAPAALRQLEEDVMMVIEPAIDELLRCDAATCIEPP